MPPAVVLAALTAFGLGGCAHEAEWVAPVSDADAGSQVRSATTISQRSLPAGTVVATGIGTSMLPGSGAGTLFVIVPTKWEDLAVGDPVVYKDPAGRQIMHRLVRLDGDRWLVKGDNNDMIDASTVTRENFVGVVVGTYFPDASAGNP